MDQAKCKHSLLIIFISCLFWVNPGHAEELEKPLIKLPQVNIIGQQDTDYPFENSGIISADLVAQSSLNESPKQDESQGFLTSSYGSFDSKLFEVEHSLKSEMFYYNAYIQIKGSDGDRDNSQFIAYKPNLSVGIPFYQENELLFNFDYFDKKMGLPGRTTLPSLNAERRNSDMVSSFSLIHKQDDSSFKFTPYYDLSIFNDDLVREDFKNKLYGLKLELANEALILDINAYQNRLVNHYKAGAGSADIKTNSIDLNDQWRAVLGINLFAQEEFGQRQSPFVELVYEENEDCLHKFTISRKYAPIQFNQTYLEDNYIEVNPELMRPVRSSEIAYNLDKHISTQWRANILVYYRQSKDYWFLTDNDNDGFYAPLAIEQANLSGINLSTEYNWSEEFNYFLSLDIRKIRSKDSDYEFVPFEPKQKISVGLTYQMTEKTKIDFVGDYFGRRYYSGNAKESSSAYFLLGSKLTYNRKDSLTFFALIDNLLNDHYEIVRGYPSQSRSILSGVTLRF
ncbi:MAG: TonB-dependent receptor [Candidatus Omnitrophica bacterium]|nr:TonB-dependent receptor [Candidatus Omnitrophota bacterium]